MAAVEAEAEAKQHASSPLSGPSVSSSGLPSPQEEKKELGELSESQKEKREEIKRLGEQGKPVKLREYFDDGKPAPSVVIDRHDIPFPLRRASGYNFASERHRLAYEKKRLERDQARDRIISERQRLDQAGDRITENVAAPAPRLPYVRFLGIFAVPAPELHKIKDY